MFARTIDSRLIAAMGGRSQVKHIRVHQRDLPRYRFVDLYRAIEHWVVEYGGAEQVLSSHPYENLDYIIQYTSRPAERTIREPPRLGWPVGVGEEVFLPTESFWLCAGDVAPGKHPIVVRLRNAEHADASRLEIAGLDDGAVAEVISAIVERSVEASIFRGQLVEIAYHPVGRDEYGDVGRPEQLQLAFKAVEPVADQDFVVDDELLEMLRRNVLDLFQRRTLLRKFGIPVRRGVLLYGPPGTGKTFACRYLCGRLPDVTKIVLTGSALASVDTAFSLARMLQPSLIIFEDADLVFVSREASFHSALIGDLLEHMDGLRRHEEVAVILTTNAIERLETAIRERPGRISQLIQFDAPQEPLRRRYLERYVARYQPHELDLDALARKSVGATQAFLKEWVHRAAQIASERVSGPHDELDLRLDDFERALAEMRRFSDGAAGRIIGFQGAR